MADEISADVVIVGSGVSSAMVAHEAVQAGLSVVILEAGARGERGDYWQRFMNLPRGQPRARRHAKPLPPTSPRAVSDVRQRRLPDPQGARRRRIPPGIPASGRRRRRAASIRR